MLRWVCYMHYYVIFHPLAFTHKLCKFSSSHGIQRPLTCHCNTGHTQVVSHGNYSHAAICLGKCLVSLGITGQTLQLAGTVLRWCGGIWRVVGVVGLVGARSQETPAIHLTYSHLLLIQSLLIQSPPSHTVTSSSYSHLILIRSPASHIFTFSYDHFSYSHLLLIGLQSPSNTITSSAYPYNNCQLDNWEPNLLKNQGKLVLRQNTHNTSTIHLAVLCSLI